MVSFYLRALGPNCIKITSEKSNSVAMFLQTHTDIEIECLGNTPLITALGAYEFKSGAVIFV